MSLVIKVESKVAGGAAKIKKIGSFARIQDARKAYEGIKRKNPEAKITIETNF